MLKQAWVAECDLCGKVAPAREITSENETRYVLPFGWAWGISDIKCAICPECIREHRRLIDD